MILKVDNLHVSYGKIAAVKGISIDVAEGEIVALIGPNGAGKSTLLKTIAGLLPANRGTIAFDGKTIANRPAAEVMRRGLALVLEGRSTLKQMTVQENLILGGYPRNDHGAIAKDMEHLLDRFPVLRDRLKQRAGTLSGGEQQMLAIARALMSRPRLLLLDEPSLGLAPLVARQIFDAIKTLNEREKLTVFLVEQNAFHALKLAHRGYVMVNGRIALTGTGRELLHMPQVKAAYLEGGRH